MYHRVVISMIVAFFLKMGVSIFLPAELLKEEIHGVASYLEVLGALYGIVLAFIIFVVWDQFNKVQMGIFLESSALEDLCHLASFISDREVSHHLRYLIREYIEVTVSDEAHFLKNGEMCQAATAAFLKLSDAVRKLDIKVPKDQIVFGGLLDALVRVNNARDARLGVSGSRIPGTLWQLVLFCSCSLVGGFLFLGIRLPLLGNVLILLIAGCITFLLEVIADMDNPFEGVWNISYSPFSSVGSRLKTLT